MSTENNGRDTFSWPDNFIESSEIETFHATPRVSEDERLKLVRQTQDQSLKTLIQTKDNYINLKDVPANIRDGIDYYTVVLATTNENGEPLPPATAIANLNQLVKDNQLYRTGLAKSLIKHFKKPA